MVNQTAYDVWENANLFVGGVVVTPAAIGANAARAAGTNVTRAVVTEIGKTTLSAGIGAVSGKAGTYFGTKFCGENVCHYVGLATGILGGVVGYGSLGAVDSHFNISGTHGFASAMSPEDAVRYEDFLKNGSQEGLTEAEVQGIAKVDEQLALNKVNYDEVLEMRRVSNGTEGGLNSNGIVNGKTPASRFADKLRGLSSSKRPNTVAVVRTADGKYYAGYNKAGAYNKNVQNVLDNIDNSNNFNRQCAEVNAISRALNKGANLNGATISIANVRGINNKSGLHGTYKEPCNVCQPLLEYYGIYDMH